MSGNDCSSGEIPVVDFSSCSIEKDDYSREELEKIGNEIIMSFNNFGCVYLKNAGISDDFVQNVFDVTGPFFAAPRKEKRKYKLPKDETVKITGFIDVGDEKTAGANSSDSYDYHEAYNLSGDGYKGVKLPNDLAPGFSNIMFEFANKGKNLGSRIHRAIALGLNLEDEFFFEQHFTQIGTEKNSSTAKVLHYPAVTGKVEPGQDRLGEHEDYTTITLIYQDDVGGLEGKISDEPYKELNRIPDTVLVISGDMLKYWSKGDIQPLKHRVVISKSSERIKFERRSLCYFLQPNNNTILDQQFVFKDKASNQRMSAKESICEPGFIFEEYFKRKIRDLYKTD